MSGPRLDRSSSYSTLPKLDSNVERVMGNATERAKKLSNEAPEKSPQPILDSLKNGRCKNTLAGRFRALAAGLFTAKGSHNVGFEITTASLVGRKSEPGSARQLKIKLSSLTEKGRDQELAEAKTAVGICNKARLYPEKITTRDLEILENTAKSLPKDSELFEAIQTIKQEIVSDIQDKTRSNPEQTTTRDLEILENIEKSLPKDSELFEDLQEIKREVAAAITCRNARINLLQVSASDLEHMSRVQGHFGVPPDSKLSKTISEVREEVTATFSEEIKNTLEAAQKTLFQQNSTTDTTLDQLLALLENSYKGMSLITNKRIPSWAQHECDKTKDTTIKNISSTFLKAKVQSLQTKGAVSFLKVLVLLENIKDTPFLSLEEKRDFAQSLQGTLQGCVKKEIRNGLQQCDNYPDNFPADTKHWLKTQIEELVDDKFLPEGTSFESMLEEILDEKPEFDSELDELVEAMEPLDLSDYSMELEEPSKYDDLNDITPYENDEEYDLPEHPSDTYDDPFSNQIENKNEEHPDVSTLPPGDLGDLPPPPGDFSGLGDLPPPPGNTTAAP